MLATHFSAAVFHQLLEALARPGTIYALPAPTFFGELPSATDLPTPINPFGLGALATLLDREVTFCLAAGGHWQSAETEVARWLSLRTGARWQAPGEADFALCLDGESAALLPALKLGTFAEPEASATTIICVEQLTTEPAETSVSMLTQLNLRGPGIRDQQQLWVVGLPSAAVAALMATRQEYPLGVDGYLIDVAGRCVGLPRTTQIVVVE